MIQDTNLSILRRNASNYVASKTKAGGKESSKEINKSKLFSLCCLLFLLASGLSWLCVCSLVHVSLTFTLLGKCSSVVYVFVLGA